MAKRKSRWRAIRHRLAQKQKFLCIYCKRRFGRKRTPLAATIEHLKAKVDGGTNAQENLAAACLHCNQHRGRQKQIAKRQSEAAAS